ncbi:MAG: GntR family transcriptional regulator [Candidatus Hydrogenedentes bacterium]|nr:GntR family transcriptional regulator [Candidatus Hydrogenedentota bacterium]
MFESININSSVAVYVQIENLVQFAIASGKLKAGDQLPSVRELSERLNLNPNTVAKSYRDLEVMGLVYTRRGMGVYINKGVEAKCRETCHHRIIERLHEVVSEAKSSGFTLKEVKSAVEKGYASDAGPYASTPDPLFDLAKSKMRPRRP